jgi:hypothetical protein
MSKNPRDVSILEGLIATLDAPAFNIRKGEPLVDFVLRFMARKAEKTGWNGGRIEVPTYRTRSGDPADPGVELAKPFPSLLDAMMLGGFCVGLQDAIEKLEWLASMYQGAAPFRMRHVMATRREPKPGQPLQYETVELWKFNAAEARQRIATAASTFEF